MKRNTKIKYEFFLNNLGTPDDDKKSNGGMVPDHARYGSWLRKNDPIAFQVGYQDFKRDSRWKQ